MDRTFTHVHDHSFLILLQGLCPTSFHEKATDTGFALFSHPRNVHKALRSLWSSRTRHPPPTESDRSMTHVSRIQFPRLCRETYRSALCFILGKVRMPLISLGLKRCGLLQADRATSHPFPIPSRRDPCVSQDHRTSRTSLSLTRGVFDTLTPIKHAEGEIDYMRPLCVRKGAHGTFQESLVSGSNHI